MPGGPAHQNRITKDSFVPVNRQNQDTFAIPKTTSDCSSLIIEGIRSTQFPDEIRNFILNLW